MKQHWEILIVFTNGTPPAKYSEFGDTPAEAICTLLIQLRDEQKMAHVGTIIVRRWSE